MQNAIMLTRGLIALDCIGTLARHWRIKPLNFIYYIQIPSSFKKQLFL